MTTKDRKRGRTTSPAFDGDREKWIGEMADWRRRIDEIDLRLVELLNRRSRCAIEIGKLKDRLRIEIYDPKREEDVIRNVQGATRGPLGKKAMKRLFERIIDESRRAEREFRDREPPQGKRKE